MENKYLVKPHQNFEAEVDIPGSKSVANRALILAAFAEGGTILRNMLFIEGYYLIKHYADNQYKGIWIPTI